MKLYIDDNCSISSLKILAISKFYCVNVNVSPSSGIRNSRIPIFEASDGSSYFSANACCRYLVEVSGNPVNYETDAWLEWESSTLQPSVGLLLKTGKGETIPADFKRNLIYLNAVLGKQNYFSGKDSLNVSDIVIWANLYPLFKSSLLSDVSDLPNIQRWILSLKNQDSLNKAFLIIFGDAKSENLKKKLAVQPIHYVQPHSFMPIDVPGISLETLTIAEVASKENEESVKEPEVTSEEITVAYEKWLKGRSILLSIKKEVPILPKEGERNVLITSALPYVNNVPHLGNIIGSVLSADVFARYCRLRGYNTLYICGTDEYGTATETKAIEKGVTPREICDEYNKLHSEIYDWFNISFDYFGRTTTNKQTEIAQDIFKKLHSQNLLLTDTVEQLYCESCKRFLADRFVEGTCPLCSYEDARGDQCDKCGKLINAPDLKNPQCKVCRTTPHLRSSKHLFLDLPKLEASIKKHLDKATSTGHWSNTAQVISYSWLKDGLKPRCITRDLKWGTPVPLEGFKDKVFYVWFDAPIGYLSITANYTEDWEKWWKQPDLVQLYQFMAKDNVPFHSIIFPASQIGTKDNYTIVNHLAAVEYLNYEDVKFSKSRGIGVFGDDAKVTGIPSDIWRFYLLYLRPEAQDTYFSWNDLMLKVNSELLNNLGNFINRALSFVNNNFGGVIPELLLGDSEKLLIAQVDQELKNYISCMEKTRLRDAIKYILNISRIGNQYIQANKPWELVKGSAAEKAKAGTILGLSANICCLLCTLLEPYMPDTFKNLKTQLNTEQSLHILINDFVCLLPKDHKIGKPVPLFKKIDQDLINNLKTKYGGRQSPDKDSSSPKKLPGKTVNKEAADNLPNGLDAEEVASLESLVTVQGNKVRELKAKKESKTEIDEAVAVLLELKKRLAVAKGENPDQFQGKSKSKKKR
ncbi:methionine--tRNA ligase, cytoplasmic-like [Stegodyphus dumicola]|uniref:methionine--tRNA ligase, cytoplasmic-like n=1 Tax=Stegodyphus dumicola TaxID=202533 RepID=UPI0015AB280F|nr:methionine--tRNA ligase, cytoplasmic-like [Stegodyphus dumicola]